MLFRTLRGRLMLVAALATLPAFLFVIYVAAKERAAALDRAESNARYVANLASREHADQVSGAARLLERLASGADAQGKVPDLDRILPAILSGFPQIANLGLIAPAGQIELSVVPAPWFVGMGDVSAFRAALRTAGVATGTYQVGPIVGRPVLILARALRESGGSVRHVLFAALELAWFEHLAQQANLPPNYSLLIADRDGAILARSASEAARGGSTLLPAGAFHEMLARSHGMTRLEGSDGVARLAVATRLEGETGVSIIVGLPETSVYAMANRVFYRDVAVLALLSLLAVASSVFATDVSILRDLRLLAHATRRFGEGDLAARAPLPRPKGEIRDLARAFNSMADALAAEHREALRGRDQLRALTHSLQNAREQEAARIAQQLHDDLGQELSVLKLELERVRKKLPGTGSPAAQEATVLIDEIGNRIDGAVQSVRRISSELRPGVLDRLGLAAGLEWLLREFERRSAIKVELITRNVDERAQPDISTALFRITQEALTNVVRHAHATRVQAELEEEDGQLVLRLCDDGTGFDPQRGDDRPSLGLLGIRERAARLGGTVEIRSAPGTGTLLVVKVAKAGSCPKQVGQDPQGNL